jgi:aryl-alcohol dehydrogenase-like predicted oxidoreductase
METRQLGSLRVSLLGLGTGRLASLGSGNTAASAARLIDAAHDLGVNVIDTADSYGSTDCERLLGDLLASRRNRFHIVTKGGHVVADLPGPFRRLNQFAKKGLQTVGRDQNFDPGRIAKAIDGSLGRLRVDVIDYYLLHWPTAADVGNEKLIDALRDAQTAGKVRHFGISSNEPEVLRMAVRIPGCTLIETAINPISHATNAPVLAEIDAAGLGVIANHVFLAGRALSSTMGADERAVSNAIDAAATRRGRSRMDVLLRFAAAQASVATVLSGTANAQHLIENATALDPSITHEDASL